MIKRFFTLIAVFSALLANGQDKTSSPYSYYGIGTPTFNGSAARRSMEGLSVFADSIHFSFQNPAGLGKLEYTTFTVGGTQKFTNIKSSTSETSLGNTSFDYLAVGIPTGNFGFGFGIIPYTSVGYKLKDVTGNSLSKFQGRGGLNKVFLSLGYRITEGLRLGVQGSYNFGKVQNQNTLLQNNIQYGSLEKNRSTLNGFQYQFGAQYEVNLKPNLRLYTSASYRPSIEITSKNTRTIATIAQTTVENDPEIVNEREISLADTKFDLPSDFRIGAGLGENQKWFVGLEYEKIGATTYTNTSFSTDNIEFKEGQVYRIGGFYIPKYNDITNYFNRITFRGGLRYQETGMRINNEDINEFGISFGVGLPTGRYFSNINIGVEYGKRGTVDAGLVQENFFNVFIGLSFNDKWFIQKKYH